MLCSSCPAIAEFPNGQNLVVPKPVLDVTHTVAPHIHGENLPDNMGRFRVGDKMIAVVRVSQIAIGDFPVDTFAPLGLGLLHRPDFLGSIAGVKLIEEVLLVKNGRKAKKVSNHAGLRRLALKTVPKGMAGNPPILDKSILFSRENASYVVFSLFSTQFVPQRI